MSDVSVWPALPDQVRHAWDQLAAACGDLHLSSAWLDYQSSTLRLPVRYGTACADGLAAALPIFELPDRPARRLYDPCVVFEASPHRPRPEARRYLLGSPAGYSNDIMLRGDLRPAVRRQVLRELVTALRAEAREDGREHELYMLYTTGRCKEILDDAGLLDDAVPTLPNYHLSLPGNSFQDYLDAFTLMAPTLRFDRRRWQWTVPVMVVAGCLVAFWALPFVFRLPYATDMGYEKLTDYTKNLFPTHLLWLFILAALGGFAVLYPPPTPRACGSPSWPCCRP